MTSFLTNSSLGIVPRKQSTTLTDGELRLMNVLWTLERATVSEVVTALPAQGRPAYNSVLTILRILERKGYLRHETQGRAFVYIPTVDRDGALRSAIQRLVSQLFDNSPSSLLLNILENASVDDATLSELRRKLKVTK